MAEADVEAEVPQGEGYEPQRRKLEAMEATLRGDPTPDGLISIETFDEKQKNPVSSSISIQASQSMNHQYWRRWRRRSGGIRPPTASSPSRSSTRSRRTP
jgi:hypothetical protein